MKRFIAALTLALAILAGSVPALEAQVAAPPAIASLGDRLETEGFDIIAIRRSWFGRLVITAIRGTALREVVVNRTTGEILSDRMFRMSHSGDTDTPAEPAAPGRRTDMPGSGSETNGNRSGQ